MVTPDGKRGGDGGDSSSPIPPPPSRVPPLFPPPDPVVAGDVVRMAWGGHLCPPCLVTLKNLPPPLPLSGIWPPGKESAGCLQKLPPPAEPLLVWLRCGAGNFPSSLRTALQVSGPIPEPHLESLVWWWEFSDTADRWLPRWPDARLE